MVTRAGIGSRSPKVLPTGCGAILQQLQSRLGPAFFVFWRARSSFGLHILRGNRAESIGAFWRIASHKARPDWQADKLVQGPREETAKESKKKPEGISRKGHKSEEKSLMLMLDVDISR